MVSGLRTNEDSLSGFLSAVRKLGEEGLATYHGVVYVVGTSLVGESDGQLSDAILTSILEVATDAEARIPQKVQSAEAEARLG